MNPVHDEMQAAGQRWGSDAIGLISAAARALVSDHSVPDIVKQRINSSHCWPDVLYVLAHQAGEFENFLRIARIDPKGAARRVTAIENLVDAAQFPAAGRVQ